MHFIELPWTYLVSAETSSMALAHGAKADIYIYSVCDHPEVKWVEIYHFIRNFFKTVTV